VHLNIAAVVDVTWGAKVAGRVLVAARVQGHRSMLFALKVAGELFTLIMVEVLLALFVSSAAGTLVVW
jgi:hypothetical protein